MTIRSTLPGLCLLVAAAAPAQGAAPFLICLSEGDAETGSEIRAIGRDGSGASIMLPPAAAAGGAMGEIVPGQYAPAAFAALADLLDARFDTLPEAAPDCQDAAPRRVIAVSYDDGTRRLRESTCAGDAVAQLHLDFATLRDGFAFTALPPEPLPADPPYHDFCRAER